MSGLLNNFIMDNLATHMGCVERLAELSDGIFAVAVTLLVLDLRVPAIERVHSEHDLWRSLLALSPRLLMYMMSFMTLGIFWVLQQTQLLTESLVDSHCVLVLCLYHAVLDVTVG